MCGVEHDPLGPFLIRTYLKVDPFIRRDLRMWMSNGLRQQAVRDEERDEKDAPYPKKILTYRHRRQPSAA
jgi:hypothetical protein